MLRLQRYVEILISFVYKEILISFVYKVNMQVLLDFVRGVVPIVKH